MCSGCGLAIRNRLYNDTEHRVCAYTSDGATVDVEPNQMAPLESFPPFGRFSISNHAGTVWVYDDFTFYSLSEGYTTWSRLPNFPIQTATKVIAVRPDGKLYLLPRGWFHWIKRKYESQQPNGFPITPTRKDKKS